MATKKKVELAEEIETAVETPEEGTAAEQPAEETVTVTKEQLKAMIDSAVAEKMAEAKPAGTGDEEPHFGGRAFMPKGPKKMVKVKLFRDNNQYKESVYVAVNGESYIVPRGVEVEVPDYVAKVLQNSIDEDQRTAEMLLQKVEEFEEKGKK